MTYHSIKRAQAHISVPNWWQFCDRGNAQIRDIGQRACCPRPEFCSGSKFDQEGTLALAAKLIQSEIVA
jgi:hypothetical protein